MVCYAYLGALLCLNRTSMPVDDDGGAWVLGPGHVTLLRLTEPADKIVQSRHVRRKESRRPPSYCIYLPTPDCLHLLTSPSHTELTYLCPQPLGDFRPLILRTARLIVQLLSDITLLIICRSMTFHRPPPVMFWACGSVR